MDSSIEIEKAVSQFNNEKFELEKRIMEIERNTQLISRD
jgi:hypothetical protein